MKSQNPLFSFYHEEELIEIFSDGIVIMYYRPEDTYTYNEWEIKKEIIGAEQRGRFIWIMTSDQVEFYLDCKLSILALHQK